MSFLRKVYNRLVKFDQDGSLYSPHGVEQREEKGFEGITVSPSLRSTPHTPKEELGIGALVTADIERLYNGR